MINTISSLSFLLYTYHNVSLDPKKKKIVTLIIKKKIEFIIYQTFFFNPKLRRIFLPHNPCSFCEELNDIFCMEGRIISGAQRILTH